jgi:glycosyltransferase involved in cell wall biosynthesis
MRVVIDGLPIRGENSLSIVVEHLLAAWRGAGSWDEVHLVLRDDADLAVPPWVVVHRVDTGGRASRLFGRSRGQNMVVPHLCRAIDADVLLGVIPATSVAPVPCARSVIVYDLRYRLRPEQFSVTARWVRRASYWLGLHQADAAVCISERTRRDLVRFYPRMRNRDVRVALLGADHVDTWTKQPAPPYALAFGHFNNKNVATVLRGWDVLRRRGPVIPLRIVGVPVAGRERLGALVDELNLAGDVEVSPWLSSDDFRAVFASSRLVVFPSDFEGFGLPAVEAMRLGIPVVVTPDPALLEVTAGHATVMAGDGADDLALAVEQALATSPHDLEAARRHAAGFSWDLFASAVRRQLVEVSSGVVDERPVAPQRVGAGRRRLPRVAMAAAAALALTSAGAAAALSGSSAPSHAPGAPPAAAAGAAPATSTTSPGASVAGTAPGAAAATVGAPASRSSGVARPYASASAPAGSVVTLPTVPCTTVTTTPPSITLPSTPLTTPGSETAAGACTQLAAGCACS